ncbi:MAG TPA: putative porin [Candidatus Dormibacteraeota bacterium]|nr:putative porin [Candidatus Dormibacteraeota bacterium]
MRKIIGMIAGTILLAGWLLIPATRAKIGDGNNPQAGAQTESQLDTAKGGDASQGTAAANSEIGLELKEVKRLLHAQQEEIETLKEQLRIVRRNSPAEAAGNPAGDKTEETKTQEQENAGKKLQHFENKLKSLGPFTFSGDFRLRDEPFFGGPPNESQVRNRERFKARFNINAKLNEDVSGGFSLASGDLNDPISTNQTTNQFYTRKPFALDRAFINYRPSYFKPLTVTGGKFAYPWYNTELTWDRDLNPEGVAQTLAFDLESTPVLKRIAFVGFQLPFAETAGVSLGNKSIVQSAVYGGQLQTTWRLASWLNFSAYVGFYNWHNADPLALAVSTANAASPANGLLPLKSTTFQNAITVTTATNIVAVNGTPQRTGVNKVVAAQLASKFGLLDTIARFDIKTPWQRWPVTLIGDYVQNTRACANAGNIQRAPADTTEVTYSQSTSAPCDPRQRRGYWGEARFGRAQEKGDWQFSYTRIFIEREAVLSAFNYSEIRQGSNVTQHRVEAFYQAHKNIQLAFTGLFGRPLNFGSSAPPERILARLQFDVAYKF